MILCVFYVNFVPFPKVRGACRGLQHIRRATSGDQLCGGTNVWRVRQGVASRDWSRSQNWCSLQVSSIDRKKMFSFWENHAIKYRKTYLWLAWIHFSTCVGFGASVCSNVFFLCKLLCHGNQSNRYEANCSRMRMSCCDVTLYDNWYLWIKVVYASITSINRVWDVTV